MFDDISHTKSRGFSTTVEYTLVALVFLSLFGGLAVTMQDDISGTSEDVAELELDRATEKLATSIEAVDDIVEDGKNVNKYTGYASEWETDAQVQIQLPDTGAAIEYTVIVDNGEVIAETQPTTSINSVVRSNVSIDATNVETVGGISGGSVVSVYYNSSSKQIEIREVNSIKNKIPEGS